MFGFNEDVPEKVAKIFGVDKDYPEDHRLFFRVSKKPTSEQIESVKSLDGVEDIFIPLFLFSLFVIVLLTTYFSQRRLTTRGDFFASFAVAGWFITIIAFVMSLTEGLINLPTIITCIIVAIVGTIMLLISMK